MPSSSGVRGRKGSSIVSFSYDSSSSKSVTTSDEEEEVEEEEGNVAKVEK
jgi:hypothetical protein